MVNCSFRYRKTKWTRILARHRKLCGEADKGKSKDRVSLDDESRLVTRKTDRIVVVNYKRKICRRERVRARPTTITGLKLTKELGIPVDPTLKEIASLVGRTCPGHLPRLRALRPAALKVLSLNGKLVPVPVGNCMRRNIWETNLKFDNLSPESAEHSGTHDGPSIDEFISRSEDMAFLKALDCCVHVKGNKRNGRFWSPFQKDPLDAW